MEHACGLAALWFGLALLATFLASRLRVSMALMEILVGVVAAAVLNAVVGENALGAMSRKAARFHRSWPTCCLTISTRS